MNLYKLTQLMVGLIVSAFFIWLVINAIPVADLILALRTAEVSWVAAAVGFFFLGYAARIWRWRLMLAPYNPRLSWGRCAVPFMISIAANNVLPFRAGDALRAVAFPGWLGVPTARILATILAERLMDLLSLMLALASALALLRVDDVGLGTLFGWSSTLFVLVTLMIALFLFFPRLAEPPIYLVLRSLSWKMPSFSDKLQLEVDRVFQTLDSLATRARMALLITWSFVAWGFEACVFYAIARALPDLVVPDAAWLAMPVGTLSTMLPSTPGYIGTFHYFVMQVAELLGNSAVVAVAFAFLIHLTLYVPAIVWGGISFCYWVLKRASGVKNSSEKATF